MGCVYRQKNRPTWWIKYRDIHGKMRYESSKSAKKEVAKRQLRDRMHNIDKGVPVTPEVTKLKFHEAVTILVNYHKSKDRKTKKMEGRIAKHLTPFFGANRLMTSITADTVEAYVAKRKADVRVIPARTKQTRKGVMAIPERQKSTTNATINRELAWLKQMFKRAIIAGRLLSRPHIELLPENNARQGFFELDQYRAVHAHLPDAIRPVIAFGYITGWRIKAEVVSLQWSQVDFKAGEVRLEPGTTKNKEGRTFPFTRELRALLEAQHAERERLKKKGHIVPWVFFRMVAKGRRGDHYPKPIKSYGKAFKTACRKAGYPARIPHDFRRTAVRNLVRAGITESVAMKMTGHKTRSVFDRYDIVSGSDLHEAARKLDAAPSQTAVAQNG
jgi:integrase